MYVFGSKENKGEGRRSWGYFFNFRDDGAKIPHFPFCLPLLVSEGK